MTADEDSRVVAVVGASLAGLRAAEALSKSGFRGRTLIFGAETHMPYNRPPLSKTHVAEAQLEWLRPGSSLTQAKWRLGDRVESVDLDKQFLTTEAGQKVEWSGLIAATGLRPRRLPVPGPAAGRFVLRTADDAQALATARARARHLVVVGAGFIGCEIAAAAATTGIAVDVVAPENVPIEPALGLTVGSELRRRLEALGVRFHLRSVPVSYTGTKVVTGVVLDHGRTLPADVVVEAVGSDPNVEWIAGNGLDLSDGVLCDGNMRVEGRPHVVACGDIARFPNLRIDAVPRRVEHWTMAIETARRAGRVLAAHLTGQATPTSPFRPVPSFWSHQANIRLQAFGSPSLGTGDVRVLEGHLEGDFAAGYHRDNALVGVVLLGLPHRYPAYRSLVEELGAAATTVAPV